MSFVAAIAGKLLQDSPLDLVLLIDRTNYFGRRVNNPTPEGCAAATRVLRKYGCFMLKNATRSIFPSILYANLQLQSQPGTAQA